MNPQATTKMTRTERMAVISLSSIMSLRMVGLFMVIPVFTLYASTLSGATPTLIGIAVGIYGLSQALFQIPFGALSDRVGRKPIILSGLLIFIAGSLIAGFSHSIYLMIIGRTLQGVGAVGSSILAMIADFTRENQRTKSMAIAGISIGASFSLAMVIGPLCTKWMPVNTLFYLASLFGGIAALLLYVAVPKPPAQTWHRDTEPDRRSFFTLLKSPELAKLNIGILFLHAIFTATFVALPISLHQSLHLSAHQQWQLYLPALAGAFLVIAFCIGRAERKQQLKFFFLTSILLLAIADLILWLLPDHRRFMMIGIGLFFTGFSLLEAFLPSLISRTAPAAHKGSALGLFSCAQFLGIFAGGVLGGWLFGLFHFQGVYLFCLLLSLSWFVLAYFMQPFHSSHS